jgi:hypothetical protein
LSVRPELNRHVERRLRAAGAEDPTMIFIALGGPTIATWGTD